MLKNKSKIFMILITCILILSTVCFATTEPTVTSTEENAVANTEDNTNTTTNTSTDSTTPAWTNSDLYLTGDKVSVSNVVDGNAFIFANEVTIEDGAEIGGDLFVFTNKLTVNGGYVYSSIFAFANEISLQGVIYDVYAICSNFTLENNGFVYRDLRVSANHVSIEGRVRRNASITANDITFGEDTSSTYIFGNLTYSSAKELSLPEGMVSGEITREQLTNTTTNPISYVTHALTIALTTFVVILLLIWLAPKFVKRVTNMGIAKSFVSLGIGIATPIIAILISFLLILSVVGISIFSSMSIALILLCMIATSITSLYIAGLLTKVFKKTSNIAIVLFSLLASLTLWALGLIPYIGWILSIVFILFGLGTTLVNIVYTKENDKKITETNTNEKE